MNGYWFSDECCLLPSQVMIPQVNPTTPIVCIASPLLPYQTFPIQVFLPLFYLITLVNFLIIKFIN